MRFPASLALLSPPDTICRGDSLQLAAAGGLTYAWTGGLDSVANPWALPVQTTTYSVTISGMACVLTDSVVVSVDTVPAGFFYPYDDTICSGQPVKITAGGGTGYLWAGPGVNGVTANNITVTPVVTSSYAVTVTDGGACAWTDTAVVVVENCCHVPGAQPFRNATASDVAAFFNCPPGGCTGQSIHIIDTLFIDLPTFTLSACSLWMDSLAVVWIPPGNTLTLSGCTVQAGCGYMWEGIYVEDSTAQCRVLAGTLVKDGVTAVHSLDGGRFSIQNSTFRDNWVGLRVGSKPGIHAGTVTGTHFTSLAGRMLPPHAGSPAECGIWTQDVDSIRIGGASWAVHNTFDSLGIGIIAQQSNVWATNNLFKEMTLKASVKGNPGYGHYATGIVALGQPGVQRPTGDWWMHVGGDSLTTNRFIDIMQGIKVVDNNNLNASHNTFRRNSGIGVRLQLNYYNNLWVRNNTFLDCTVGVKGTLNTGSVVDVSHNRMRADAQHPGHGVWLSDFNVFGTNPPNNGSASVTGNHFSLWGYGVMLEGVGAASILRNTDTIRGVHPQTLKAAGISVYASDKAKVRDNAVLSLAPPADSADGLLFMLSNRLEVTCNRMTACKTALHTWGSCDMSVVRHNEFRDGDKGIVLQDNGIIGQQGMPDPPGPQQGEPSGNKWLGSWTCGSSEMMVFTYNTTPGPFQQFYVRNTVQMNPAHPANQFCNGAFSGIPITFTTTNGLIPTCGTNPPNVALGGSNAGLKQVATDTRSYSVHPSEARYIDMQMLLDTLEHDPALRQGDPDFQAFHAAHINATPGKIGRMQDALVSLQPGLAAAEASYSPSNLIEQNHKQVVMALDDMLGPPAELTLQDSLALEEIAAQCPLTGGKAVFIARSALQVFAYGRVFDDQNCSPQQRKSAEEPEDGKNVVRLVPNPASSEVMILSSVGCSVQIIGMQGQEVARFEVPAGGLAVDVSRWARGVYMVRYATKAGMTGSIRLVLQ